MQKRFLSLFLILAALFSLAACGAPTPSGDGSLSDESAEETLKTIQVPDVLDMTLADAEKELFNSGFVSVCSNEDQYPSLSKDELIVTEQTPSGGKSVFPDDVIQLTCAKMCELYLDLESEYNLLFNKYDIEIFLDGKEIGIIPNGDAFTKLTEVLSGEHTLTAYKSGDHDTKAEKVLSVDDSMTFSAIVAHGSGIEFKNSSISSDVQGARVEMISVVHISLSQAREALTACGFINIQGEPSDEIWNEGNWVVTSQSIPAGETADKNDEIILTCQKFDDYVREFYAGKTLVEAEASAEYNGYTLKCTNSEGNTSLDSVIPTLSEEIKERWIIEDAQLYSATLYLTLTYQKTPEEIAAENAQKQLLAKLEEYFPRENAKKAIIVAFTNNSSSDVFTDDGNYYDAEKLHGYNYHGEYRQTVTDEGTWTALDDKTWHIENMHLLLTSYNTATRLSCDVTYDGETYTVFHVRYMTASPEYIDTEDPFKTSGWETMEPGDFYIHLTMPQDMVTGYGGQNTTPTPRPTTEAEWQRAELEKYEDWVESQFKWDGSHRTLTNLIKQNLNDEKSYKHIQTEHYSVLNETQAAECSKLMKEWGCDIQVKKYDLIIVTDFSAKNAYNATVKLTAIGIANYDTNKVRLIDIQLTLD